MHRYCAVSDKLHRQHKFMKHVKHRPTLSEMQLGTIMSEIELGNIFAVSHARLVEVNKSKHYFVCTKHMFNFTKENMLCETILLV